MAKISILYRNEADFGTVTADQELSTLPVSFLLQPQLTKVWRTPDSTTTANISIDFGANRTIRSVAVLACNLTAAGTARVRLSTVSSGGTDVYDSGTGNADVDAVYRSFVRVLPSDLSARYAVITLTDATLTYIEAGRLVAGAMWVPEFNYDRNSIEKGTIDDSPRELAISGEAWIEARPVRRRVRFALPRVNMAELAAHLDAMGRLAGRKRDVLVVIDSEADSVPQETYWGLMTEAPNVVNAGFRAWRQSIEVITQQ